MYTYYANLKIHSTWYVINKQESEYQFGYTQHCTLQQSLIAYTVPYHCYTNNLSMFPTNSKPVVSNKGWMIPETFIQYDSKYFIMVLIPKYCMENTYII